MMISNLRDLLDRDRLTVARYKFGSKFTALVPPSFDSSMAYGFGLLAYVFSPNKRQLVIDNLLRASSSKNGWLARNKLALLGYCSYARYWVEALAVGELTRRDLNARMSIYGFEHVYEALGRGKGIIFTTPHLGNWDFGAAWLASGGYPITAVMEELEPPELFEWFASHRIKFGVKAIPATASAFGELAKALSRGEVVALVADRDISGSGIQVPFFGEATSIPQGVALLSLRTGAPIIAAAVYLLPGGGHFALVTDAITLARSDSLRDDVRILTGMLVERYESLIRADPAQWHLFQPNWPSQLESR
ncbi:MAG: hypothetical protein EPN30_04395 [Actinomycetota bacterium]|nr:MAG: hypothetical protein EPN30_04395 [Actinomycetota bacterium]